MSLLVGSTKKAIGQRGSWFASVDDELLPCVHKYWFKSGLYDDPYGRSTDQKFVELFNAIREKEKVILTQDEVAETSGEPGFSRIGYFGIFAVDRVVLDDSGLRFRFTDRLAHLE
jgi:hypothetical protein